MSLRDQISAGKLPQKIRWVLQILNDAHPARVEPASYGMQSAAHWAWSLGLALRHFNHGQPLTYSISPSGRAAILRALEAEGDK